MGASYVLVFFASFKSLTTPIFIYNSWASTHNNSLRLSREFIHLSAKTAIKDANKAKDVIAGSKFGAHIAHATAAKKAILDRSGTIIFIILCMYISCFVV